MADRVHTSKGLTVHQSTGKHVFTQKVRTHTSTVVAGKGTQGHLSFPVESAVQRLTTTGYLDGGHFKLIFTTPAGAAQKTGDIVWNCSPSDVQTALEALAGIAVGDVVVAGKPFLTEYKPSTQERGYIDIAFIGLLAYQEITLLTVEDQDLTNTDLKHDGGAVGTVVVTNIQPGYSGFSKDLSASGLDDQMTWSSFESEAVVEPYLNGAQQLVRTGTVTVPTAPDGSEENTRGYWQGPSGRAGGSGTYGHTNKTFGQKATVFSSTDYQAMYGSM